MRLWPRSLTARILLVEGMAIAVVIVVLPLLTVSLLHLTMKEYQTRSLTAQAQEIAGGLAWRGGTVRVRLPASLSAVYATAYDGRAYALLDERGRIVATSDSARRLSIRRVPRHPAPARFDLPPLTGVSLPVVTSQHAPLWVVVSQDQAEPGAILDDVVETFLWRYLGVLVVVLLLLPLVNSVLIRRLVLAVRRVSDRAATMGPESLDMRLDERDLPSEVAPLVHATNDLIARLQQRISAQRDFVGNVAHELRTPLSALKIQLDCVPDAIARGALHRSLDRVSHVVSQVRDLAGLETLEARRRRNFDLSDIAREAIGELAPEVYAAGDTIDLVAPDRPVMVSGEPTLARLALSNLLSNATRHTPAGTAISVTVNTDGAVSVADTGPGIATAMRGLVSQRFWRADQHRSDSAGLGLSIVQRIMQVHGGRLEIISDSGNGAVFRLFFLCM